MQKTPLWQRFIGVSLLWPQLLVVAVVVVILSIAFLLTYFLESTGVAALAISSVLLGYFNVVYLSQAIGIVFNINRLPRMPLDKTTPMKIYNILDNVRLYQAIFLIAFAVVQHGFFVASLSVVEPDQFTGTNVDRWSLLLRSLFQSVDTVATIGYGPTRPIKNLGGIFFLINVLQIYSIDLLIFAIALTRLPAEIPWLMNMRYKGIFSSAGTSGRWVLALRLIIAGLIFGIGFIDNEVVNWAIFGVAVAYYLHHIGVFFVYAYDALLNQRQQFLIGVFILIYMDILASVALTTASFSRIAPNQIFALDANIAWWTRVVRSLGFTIDTLVGYGALATIPIGNWAVAWCAIVITKGFFLRITVLNNIYNRFVNKNTPEGLEK